MNTGQNLYQKAKSSSLGKSVLSKRPEMFLPDFGHLIMRRQKVARYDLDQNKFVDMSNMGIGTCSLGYATQS